jgi:hypothetical protein
MRQKGAADGLKKRELASFANTTLEKSANITQKLMS